MKKQLFTLFALFALMLVGVSAWAQGTIGLLPGTAKELIAGSAAHFQITDGSGGEGAAETHSWAVYTMASTADFNAAGVAALDASYNFVADLASEASIAAPTGTDANVRFLTSPGAGNVYMVEYIGTNTTNGASCTTRRRFFISIFDFEVNVQLATTELGALLVETDADHPSCNSWDNSVIKNGIGGAIPDYYEGTDITGMHGDNVDNDVAAGSGGSKPKYTDLWYVVNIRLINNTSMDLDDIKWRFRYSLYDDEAVATAVVTPDADLSIYQLQSLTAGAFFGTGAADALLDGTFTGEVTIAASTNAFAAVNSVVNVAATAGTTGSGAVQANQTASYVFRVRTHNLLGDNDQTWGIRVDEAQLETTLAGTDYGNGRKMHSSLITAGVTIPLADGRSDTYTIRQTPATQVIRVND